MEPYENAMEVRNLRKAFGVLRAVDGIDFDLKRGEFLTVFGPNGAGKTTTINIPGFCFHILLINFCIFSIKF